MEGCKVEETWKNFWQSGKVTDYLSYKDSYKEQKKDTKERLTDVADSRVDRNGFKCHANWRL